MTRKLILGALAALFLAAVGAGCSAEGKAEKALQKYEKRTQADKGEGTGNSSQGDT